MAEYQRVLHFRRKDLLDRVRYNLKAQWAEGHRHGHEF